MSEGSHVRWLKVLGRVFLRPLESQPSLLAPDDLRALFPNLPSVRERHARLYSELRALRTDVDAPLVDVRAVADAMLNTVSHHLSLFIPLHLISTRVFLFHSHNRLPTFNPFHWAHFS